MDFGSFRKAGHWPTLLAAFLYFDVSFMVWVTLGPLMIYIAKDIPLTVSERFTLVSIPVLSGALCRIPLGALADRLGGKKTAIGAQLLVIAAISWAWLASLTAESQIAILGACLGVAGASFAVALPQASRWYPPRYQGLVMGIAGAGNMGVVLDAMLVPWLAERWGWQNAFGFLLLPLALVLILYVAMAQDAPGERKPVTLANYKALLRDQDSWWFMFFYSITFGGFVGLANALPLYFTIQYHVSGIAAGLMVAVIVMFGSCFRPVGGLLADRIGGIRSLLVLFSVVAAAYFVNAQMPAGPEPANGGSWSFLELPAIAWASVVLFSSGVLALGMGNGAVFQLIPQRFRHEIGTMTGVVGCAGGIGGFFLAQALGLSKSLSGNFSMGFIGFGFLALLGLLALTRLKTRWRTTWGALSEARI